MRMDGTNRQILILEYDQVLCARLRDAFMLVGYEVQVTSHTDEAMGMLRLGHNSRSNFDLVIVDISDKRNLQFASDVQFIDLTIPIFAVKNILDKELIISSLKEMRFDFIEHFIKSHAAVQRCAMPRCYSAA